MLCNYDKDNNKNGVNSSSKYDHNSNIGNDDKLINNDT